MFLNKFSTKKKKKKIKNKNPKKKNLREVLTKPVEVGQLGYSKVEYNL